MSDDALSTDPRLQGWQKRLLHLQHLLLLFQEAGDTLHEGGRMGRFITYSRIYKATLRAMSMAEALLGRLPFFRALMCCLRDMAPEIAALNAKLVALMNPAWARDVQRPRFVN